MKKTLLTLALAIIAMAAGAQAQDNNNCKWVVGGTGHFNQSTDKTGDDVTNKVREYRIEPFVGYNINDRWRVGLTYGFSLDHRYELNASGQLFDIGTKRTYRVGPYVHYNIVKYKRWILFAEAEALLGYSPRYMNPGPGSTPGVGGAPAMPGPGAYDAKLQTFDLTIKPGFLDRWYGDVTAGYQSPKYYEGVLRMNRLSKTDPVMVYADANNVDKTHRFSMNSGMSTHGSGFGQEQGCLGRLSAQLAAQGRNARFEEQL